MGGDCVAAFFVVDEDAGFAELAQAVVEHAGGELVAARAQLAEGEGLSAQLPEDAQRPASAEQIEEHHERAPGAGAARGLERGEGGLFALHYEFRSTGPDRDPLCYGKRSEGEAMVARIQPVQPPYSPDLAEALAKWMPPGSGVAPLVLFRTLARHPRLSERMRGLGAAFLGKAALLPVQLRELVILRVSALCGARYEWGVHAAAFASAAGIDRALLASTHGTALGGFEPRMDDAGLVLRLADELHGTQRVTDALFAALSARFAAEQVLELVALVGYYHLIAMLVNGLALPSEPWSREAW